MSGGDFIPAAGAAARGQVSIPELGAGLAPRHPKGAVPLP